jgi:hypothetical protein
LLELRELGVGASTPSGGLLDEGARRAKLGLSLGELLLELGGARFCGSRALEVTARFSPLEGQGFELGAVFLIARESRLVRSPERATGFGDGVACGAARCARLVELGEQGLRAIARRRLSGGRVRCDEHRAHDDEAKP